MTSDKQKDGASCFVGGDPPVASASAQLNTKPSGNKRHSNSNWTIRQDRYNILMMFCARLAITVLIAQGVLQGIVALDHVRHRARPDQLRGQRLGPFCAPKSRRINDDGHYT